MDCISIPHRIVSAFTSLIMGQFWVESAFLTNRLMSGKNLIGQPSCSLSTQQLTNHCQLLINNAREESTTCMRAKQQILVFHQQQKINCMYIVLTFMRAFHS